MERFKQILEMKLQKETRKERRLELKADQAKQQPEIELLKTEHANQEQFLKLQKLEMPKKGLLQSTSAAISNACSAKEIAE